MNVYTIRNRKSEADEAIGQDVIESKADAPNLSPNGVSHHRTAKWYGGSSSQETHQTSRRGLMAVSFQVAKKC